MAVVGKWLFNSFDVGLLKRIMFWNIILNKEKQYPFVSSWTVVVPATRAAPVKFGGQPPLVPLPPSLQPGKRIVICSTNRPSLHGTIPDPGWDEGKSLVCWPSSVSRKGQGHTHEAKGLGLSRENQARLPSPFVTSCMSVLSVALHFITCQLLKITPGSGSKSLLQSLMLEMFLLMTQAKIN